MDSAPPAHLPTSPRDLPGGPPSSRSGPPQGPEQAATEPLDGIRQEPPTGILGRHVPAVAALRHYSPAAFRADLGAGFTVAAVAVPQALAYALVAGLPPRYGLATAIVLPLVAGLFSSSRQLIHGPTNAIAITLLCTLAPLPAAQRAHAAVVLALLVGVVQVGIALLRPGDLTRYISPGVTVGFLAGAGCLLVLDQLKHLLGLAAQGRPGDHFLRRFWLTMAHGHGVNAWTLAIGAGSLALILALRRLAGRARVQVPEYLVVVVGMAVLVRTCGLEQRGVAVVGTIPATPLAFELPAIRWSDVQTLGGSALTIALLGLFESVAMTRVLADRTGQDVDIRQQCLSEGLANLAGSFFHCFPGSGSFTRSSLNQQAGAATQWSSIISAGAVAGIVLVLAPLARSIPRATLAAVLLVSAARLLHPRQLLHQLGADRREALIVLATALSAVALSVQSSILVGVGLSLALALLPRQGPAGVYPSRPPALQYPRAR